MAGIWREHVFCAFRMALPIWGLLSLSYTSTHITAQKFPSPRWEGSSCLNLVLLKITLVVGLCTPSSFFYLLLLTWRSLRKTFCFLHLSFLCVLWSAVSSVKLPLSALYFCGFFNEFDSPRRLLFTANVIVLFALIPFFLI